LVAGCGTESGPEAFRSELVRSLGRLRQFLSENGDIADALAIEDLEVAVLGRAAGA
jgi:hypothetical protein